MCSVEQHGVECMRPPIRQLFMNVERFRAQEERSEKKAPAVEPSSIAVLKTRTMSRLFTSPSV